MQLSSSDVAKYFHHHRILAYVFLVFLIILSGSIIFLSVQTQKEQNYDTRSNASERPLPDLLVESVQAVVQGNGKYHIYADVRNASDYPSNVPVSVSLNINISGITMGAQQVPILTPHLAWHTYLKEVDALPCNVSVNVDPDFKLMEMNKKNNQYTQHFDCPLSLLRVDDIQVVDQSNGTWRVFVDVRNNADIPTSESYKVKVLIDGKYVTPVQEVPPLPANRAFHTYITALTNIPCKINAMADTNLDKGLTKTFPCSR